MVNNLNDWGEVEISSFIYPLTNVSNSKRGKVVFKNTLANSIRIFLNLDFQCSAVLFSSSPRFWCFNSSCNVLAVERRVIHLFLRSKHSSWLKKINFFIIHFFNRNTSCKLDEPKGVLLLYIYLCIFSCMLLAQLHLLT